MLGTFGLALYYDTGGNMGHAHGGRDFVDILTARAGSTIGIDTDIILFYIDRDVVFDFGNNIDRRERCMTPLVGIERRYAYKAMDAGFGLKITEGIFAFDFDGYGFYTGLLVSA
jgi:hypothetical protein